MNHPRACGALAARQQDRRHEHTWVAFLLLLVLVYSYAAALCPLFASVVSHHGCERYSWAGTLVTVSGVRNSVFFFVTLGWLKHPYVVSCAVTRGPLDTPRFVPPGLNLTPSPAVTIKRKPERYCLVTISRGCGPLFRWFCHTLLGSGTSYYPCPPTVLKMLCAPYRLASRPPLQTSLHHTLAVFPSSLSSSPWNMQSMPCPLAEEIGELLNLSPSPTTATDAASGSTDKVSSGGDGSGRPRRSSLGNRWLHDVMEVAETMEAERVEIILDEQVHSYFFLCMISCCERSSFGKRVLTCSRPVAVPSIFPTELDSP